MVAEIDEDGNDSISLREMINFEKKKGNEQGVLTIGIYWIGYVLTP